MIRSIQAPTAVCSLESSTDMSIPVRIPLTLTMFRCSMFSFVFCALWTPLLVSSVAAQEAPEETSSKQKPWAREPKAIPFQNDSQWEDNRWQKTDIGPFLAGSFASPEGAVLKGLCIRVGDQQQAAVCYDTARLNQVFAWTGEFLQFSSRRFGLIKKPQIAGTIGAKLPKEAGWAFEGRFTPTNDEQNWSGQTKGVTRLPVEWAHYRGFHVNGRRVILEYTVGKTRVLESPWFVEDNSGSAFTRTFEVSPHSNTMQVRLAKADSEIRVLPPDSVSLTHSNGITTATLRPSDSVLRFKVISCPADSSAATQNGLTAMAGPAENLELLCGQDSGRFPTPVVTRGITSGSDAAYVIDTLTLPFENPWNALMFTSGHDFFANGDVAVCMAHGDVWRGSWNDDDISTLTWRRYATGLCQPLGLRVVNDVAHVIGKDQITRLIDSNEDGEVDHYQNFNNAQWASGGDHEYLACLDTDGAGNFYYIHARTGVMKVSPDGEALESLADGFRNPNGIGVNRAGLVTAAPQEGTWTPASSIAVVRKGGYYGFGGPRPGEERPLGYDLPMCYMPRSLDNSSGGQVWVESDQWGPLKNRMLHLSYGRCRLLLTLMEQKGGIWQGGTMDLETSPSDFESGIMRGRFHPIDGQLYVSGLRGWQTRAVRDGCLQRVRYTGRDVCMPVGVETMSNGVQLTFSSPLDAGSAGSPDSYFAEQWNYRWTKNYGSEDYRVSSPSQTGRDEVEIRSATLSSNGKSVFLEIPALQPVMQLGISWTLKSTKGEIVRQTYVHTIHSVGTEEFPESRIVRREARQLVTPEVESRLRPGLQFDFQVLPTASSRIGLTDSRVERMAAFQHDDDSAVTPFLPAGPTRVSANGFIRTQLAGFYEFSSEGDRRLSLSINGQPVTFAPDDRSSAVRIPVMLQRGLNRIELTGLVTRRSGTAFRLLWRSDEFDWEPVPPNALRHDPGTPNMAHSTNLRTGRELYLSHQCGRCHQDRLSRESESSPVEFAMQAPDLTQVTSRVSDEWLAQWLKSPSSIRHAARMPSVLDAESEEVADKQVADLISWLRSSTSKESNAGTDKAASNQDADTRVLAARGSILYEDLGCIACHRTTRASEADEWSRVSLHFVSVKFKPGMLSKFLLNPGLHASETRMPNFKLTETEAASLASYLRRENSASLPDIDLTKADKSNGRQLFGSLGCSSCHTVKGIQRPAPLVASLFGRGTRVTGGCLAANSKSKVRTPQFQFLSDQTAAISTFLRTDGTSLGKVSHNESATRLYKSLNCSACHERDGQSSRLGEVLVEEGRGLLPKPAPTLTWTGEKLHLDWSRRFLSGELAERTRPWLKTRMPAFSPLIATTLAHGFARQHASDFEELTDRRVDENLLKTGLQLTTQSGLDCRQCHGIGSVEPRGDEKTKIHLGINFLHTQERLRYDYYRRFTLNPPRYEPNSNMPRLTDDRMRTKVRGILDGDAAAQFDAVWDYIQSLPPDDRPRAGN